MKFRRKQRENVDINLASLIDVVFILLLFFRRDHHLHPRDPAARRLA